MVKFSSYDFTRDHFRKHFPYYNSICITKFASRCFAQYASPSLYLSQNVDSCVAIFISITFATKTQPYENAVEDTFVPTWHVIKQHYRYSRMDRMKATRYDAHALFPRDTCY